MAVACGLHHSAAVAENGTLYVWGLGDYGQHGLGDTASNPYGDSGSHLARKGDAQLLSISYHQASLYEGLLPSRRERMDEVMDNRLRPSSMNTVMTAHGGPTRPRFLAF